MRYDDWDIILFPTGRDEKIPFKEFNVACHGVPDLELAHIHGPQNLPIMTCFVPSLPPATPFQISIHNWRVPDITQFTRSYSKHTELVQFEARILIDGRLVASTAFNRSVNGPHIIKSTFEFTKSGEHERLKFPMFRNEMIYQTHWNPVDDIGRIKVIISEGFPRDSLSVPIERVKNVVVFSFQHAPLEILESNGIAWPNPNMWRCPPFTPSIPVPTFRPEDGANSHTHSPRRVLKPSKSQGFTGPIFPGGASNSFTYPFPYLTRAVTTVATTPFGDPFTESAVFFDWGNTTAYGQSSDGIGSDILGKARWPTSARELRKDSSDTSMPDYVPPQAEPIPMHISGPSLEDDPMSLKVPTNTPTAGPVEDLQGVQFSLASFSSNFPGDIGTSLTNSLLNQPLPLSLQPHNIPLPASDIKSRKENRHLTVGGSNPSSEQSTPHAEHVDIRKFSQTLFTLGDVRSGNTVSTGSDSASIHSPTLQSVFSSTLSRHSSAGDFGGSANPHQNPVMDPSCNLPNMGLGTSGVKRTRNFTPASAKAIDEEDEPRRASPHVRIAGFGGDLAHEV